MFVMNGIGSSPRISGSELMAWTAFTTLMTTYSTEIDARLKRDIGLNLFEYTILAGLSHAEDRTMPIAALARLVAGSQSRVSHAVDRLQRRGLAGRGNPSAGARGADVFLTDAGMAAFTEAAPRHAGTARRFVVDVLAPDELRQLRRLCERLLRATAPATAELIGHGISEVACGGHSSTARPERDDRSDRSAGDRSSTRCRRRCDAIRACRSRCCPDGGL
ncbi:MarR family winged helix-turn-helix transcriptional regulator [Actinoplanes sp. NPDC023714]|uniref:MarR family winged helix-turn-helix transcriptional regulator n=1 Tax=Actinoplanes sp. NPDC023714 TaxID=3154322 RepID=UPI0033CD7807